MFKGGVLLGYRLGVLLELNAIVFCFSSCKQKKEEGLPFPRFVMVILYKTRMYLAHDTSLQYLTLPNDT
jgi:hypothetical protein